jgi:hypothetical protein
MSYIGNNPEVNAFTIGVDKFNGTGACTQFTLTRDIDDVNALEVVVNGVQQEPTAAYTVSNGVITFDEAPSSGTNNIIVTYRAPVVVTFNQVTSSQLQANSVTGTALSDNSVIESKIATNAVTGPKIGLNAITGNLLGISSVSTNNIVTGGISGNLLGINSVSGNNLTTGSVTGNVLGINSVTGNTLGLYSVSGNNIGIGAISANNFAGGGITSNVLSSNLTISTARISESINIISSSPSGNYNVHVSNSSVYLFTANAASNVTFNLVANAGLAGGTTGSLNDLVVTGNTVSVALIIKMVDSNGRKYRANVFVDGVAQQAIWTGNVQPQYYDLSQVQQWDMYNFQIVKVGTTGSGMSRGQYLVFASNTTFGYANGQGMGPTLTQ